MDVAALLIRNGVLSQNQVEQLADVESGRIDHAAVERGLAREEDVLRALADAFGMQFADLSTFEVCPDLLHCFPSQELARHFVAGSCSWLESNELNFEQAIEMWWALWEPVFRALRFVPSASLVGVPKVV